MGIGAASEFIILLLEKLIGAQQSAAQQATSDAILQAVNGMLTQVNAILSELTDGQSGLGAIRTALDEDSDLATLQYSDLVARIGTPAQAGDPATLPVTPPSGYGPDNAGAADSVWTTPLTSQGILARDLLAAAGNIAINTGDYPFLYRVAPLGILGITFPIASEVQAIGNFDEIDDSLTDILPDDTMLSWFTRRNPLASVTSLPNGQVWIQADAIITQNCDLFTLISEGEFQLIKASQLGVPTMTAPVWPGADRVTLLSAVAIAPGVTIDVPMDGVILAVTAVAPSTSFFQFDDVKSYRYVGALSFYNDLGEQEWPQTYGFQSAIFTVQTMTRAAGVKVRAVPGVVGTITPWTINP